MPEAVLQHSPRPGQELVPGYHVVEHLARSRRYDVYTVWSSTRMCACVAKTPRPDRASDESARADLLHEGDLLLDMSHVHLVRAWDVVRGPRPALILEPLTGRTLEYLVDHRRRRLSVDDLATLGLQLCSVAGYLHSRGILHLDLKPSNIVQEGRHVKVIDLSIASEPGRQKPETGTPQYMAPEQVRGEPLSAATDVWGIGAVLFQAATGAVPFGDEPDSLEQVKRRAVPVESLRRVPLAFAEGIDRCLEPDPSRRPAVPSLARTLAAFVKEPFAAWYARSA